MTLTFNGRIEARCTIPTGGAAVSATVPNGAGAQTVTVPAAGYYLTAAGSVSSLLTTFQTQLNSTANLMGFPQTAAAMASAVGSGTYTTGAGWLFQESSGNLASVYGSQTFTATTLTYQNSGIKTGDYAVGFTTTTSNGNAGDVLDVDATSDLIIAWVGYLSGTPGNPTMLISKYNGAGALYMIRYSGGAYRFDIDDGAGHAFNCAIATACPLNTWHVGMAVIDRGANTFRIATQTLAGTAAISTNTSCTSLGTLETAASLILGRNASANNAAPELTLSALYIATGTGCASGMAANLATATSNFANSINASWAASFSTTTGLASLAWTGYPTPTWSLSWTSTELRDMLGFASNISGVTTTQTGTLQCKSLFFPDCPLNLDGDPEQAPKISDLRTSQSPTGVVLGLCGNTFYRHTGLVYSHVPRAQVWDSAATYENGSFEEWFSETQMGQGSTWFTPASPIQVYLHDGTRLGSAQNISGWTITGLDRIEPKKSVGQWTGLFRIEFGTLISDG